MFPPFKKFNLLKEGNSPVSSNTDVFSVEEGQALASIIEYITGFNFVDVESVKPESITFTYQLHEDGIQGSREGSITLQALREGMTRIQNEIIYSYGLINSVSVT